MSAPVLLNSGPEHFLIGGIALAILLVALLLVKALGDGRPHS